MLKKVEHRSLIVNTQIRTLLLMAIGMFASSCDSSDCEGIPKLNCACNEMYAPVCGCDGETYPNACHADCEGIHDYVEGECN